MLRRGGEVIQTMVVQPSLMFDIELDKIDDPFFRCTANRLCQSVGDETSQILICINCNISAHLFWAEYLQFQNPVEELHVIALEDLSKEGKSRWKKTPVIEKNDVVFAFFVRQKSKQLRFSHMQQSLWRRRASARRRKILNTNRSTNPHLQRNLAWQRHQLISSGSFAA